MAQTNHDAPSVRPPWLTDEIYPFASQFIALEGHTLHYIDEGAGPALLIVHPTFWSIIFRDLVIRLRRRYRVIVLDFPDNGLSTAAPGYDHSVASNSRILERFVKTLDLRDITLFVHDLGGAIGLGFAARQPDRIRALIISQAFAWPLGEYPMVERMLRFMRSGPSRLVNGRLGLLARMSSGRFGVGRRWNAADRKAFVTVYQVPRRRMTPIRVLGSAVGIDDWMVSVGRALTTTLGDRPVLTIFGSRNDPMHWQDRYARELPQSGRFTLPGGIHFPFADDPDAVADEIERWWEEAVEPTPTDRTAA